MRTKILPFSGETNKQINSNTNTLCGKKRQLRPVLELDQLSGRLALNENKWQRYGCLNAMTKRLWHPKSKSGLTDPARFFTGNTVVCALRAIDRNHFGCKYFFSLFRVVSFYPALCSFYSPLHKCLKITYVHWGCACRCLPGRNAMSEL